MSKSIFIGILVIAALLGTTVGYVGTTLMASGKSSASAAGDKTGTTAFGKKSEGILDKKRFPDQAEGKLKDGGIEGEGSFHLERAGGESQNVYLTSSTVDLSSYIGKKVRVRGETQKAQKAGWLMDVGYVEVL